MNWSDFFRESALSDLDLRPVLVSLVLSLIFGQLLAWHYCRYSPVLSHKRKFARMFTFLVVTTMLVITVVKTSLALSLGLVGALSIIRFRTPIKEPEDLAYLFLAVAVGIGFGADQRLVTSVVCIAFLIFLTVSKANAGGALPPRMLVHVTAKLAAQEGAAGDADQAVEALLKEVESAATQVDLRRVDLHGEEFNANLILDLKDPRKVGALVNGIQGVLPGANVSVVEGAALD